MSLLQIKEYLETFLQYDWVQFNALNKREQCEKWNILQTNFIDIVKAYSNNKEFDFEAIYSLIQSYHDIFDALPIKGKIYVRVNSFLLSGQLIALVKELEYQSITKNSDLDCDCHVRHRLGKSPETSMLSEIGIINDSYYMPKLFFCPTCNFKWISFIEDDSTGNTCYEKFDPSDEPFVEYRNKN